MLGNEFNLTESMYQLKKHILRHSKLFDFRIGTDGGEKYLAGIIVLAILLAISVVIIAYFIYQNRRKISTDIDENPDNGDANDEHVEDEQSTYTALNRAANEENDDHLYTHLNEVHHDYVNQVIVKTGV